MRRIARFTAILTSAYVAGNVYAADIGNSIMGGSTPTNDALKTFTGGTKDIILIVTNILNYLLGLLGLFFVILLIYGGYKWMVNGGEDEEIKKAKNIIKNAIIGIVVVMVSWTLAYFVISVTATKFLKK